VERDDGCETTMKDNDDSGWSSSNMALRLGRRKNRDMVEW
jgi:hypothetical protein